MSDPIKEAIERLRDECWHDSVEAIEALRAEVERLRDAVLAALQPLPNRGHVTRYSDSSQYDEVCTKCGMTDAIHSKQSTRNIDCPHAPAIEARILAALNQPAA